ncbi:MAG TPA: Uma2 family endonuclease [Verrucomicrobiae bacterium]
MNSAPVAERKKWTEAELQALPEDGFIHEVVNGELVMSPKNNPEHGFICTELSFALTTFVKREKLGAVSDSNTGFWMENENCRAPDVSFVSKERLRGLKRPAKEFFRFAPDLAIEVLSPNNTRAEIHERLRDFFSSGTRLAWVIDPEMKSAEICYSLEKRKLVGPNGELDGETVVPGFRLKLAELFREWNWD